MKKLKEEIMAYINEKHFEPARKRGIDEITLRAGDIHDAMRLDNRQPSVCDTMRGNKIQEKYGVKMIREERGENVTQEYAKNIWYTFKLL